MANDFYSHSVDTQDGYVWVIHTDGHDFWVDSLEFTEEDGSVTTFNSPSVVPSALHDLITYSPKLLVFYSYPPTALPSNMIFPQSHNEDTQGGCDAVYVD